MNEITFDIMEYIIGRILGNAKEAAHECWEDNENLYKNGREEAYYEVLDMIKNDFIMYDIDLKKVGLDIDLDNLISAK